MGAYIYDPVKKELVPLVSNDDHLTDEMIAGYEATNLATNAYSVGEQLIYNGKLYTVTSPIAVGDDITGRIAESESLSKQLLGYEKKIWKGTEEEWEALSAAEKAKYSTAIITNDTINSPVEFQGATENTNGTKGLVKQPLAGDQNKVLYGDGSWKRINNDISNLASAYDASLTYAVGDLVTYIDSQGSGKLYKCIVAVTTPEAFNINKWDDVTASDVFTKKSKIIATHTGNVNETWRDALNALVTGIVFDPEKEYLIRIKKTENGTPVTGIYHVDSIKADGIVASASEITNAVLYVTSIYCNTSLSTYSTSAVDQNGYTYTSHTAVNLPGYRTFELVEINTL